MQYDERIKKVRRITQHAMQFHTFTAFLQPFFPLYARHKGVTSLDDRGLHFLDPSYS